MWNWNDCRIQVQEVAVEKGVADSLLLLVVGDVFVVYIFGITV